MKRQSVTLVRKAQYDDGMDHLSRLSAPALVVADPGLLPAEDLTVQVHHDDGHWHRRAIGGQRLACGEQLRSLGGNGLRMETYSGPLCKGGCFSPWELEESRRLNEAERQRLLAFTPAPIKP